MPPGMPGCASLLYKPARTGLIPETGISSETPTLELHVPKQRIVRCRIADSQTVVEKTLHLSQLRLLRTAAVARMRKSGMSTFKPQEKEAYLTESAR